MRHLRAAACALALLAPLVLAAPAPAHGLALVDAHEDAPGGANTGGRRMIQAEEAWSLGYRGEGIRIAILGTGIDPTHEAFRRADGSSRVVGWIDYVNGAGAPYDDHGHSTYVAGSAAGSDLYVDPVHGAFQEAGVAPGADLVVAKFLDAGGSGSIANAMSALQWAADQGADVAVNAWGAGSCNSAAIPLLQLVRQLSEGGMELVFSAGAGGPGPGTIGAPACSESAITVGAIGANQTIYGPSGRGPCSDVELGAPPRICPDLVAKGSPVRSAAPRGACSLCDASGYRVIHGTSAPVGFVGGAAALAEQMKRATTGTGFAAGALEIALKQTALDLGPPGPDDTYGWGLPQLFSLHDLLDPTTGARVVLQFDGPAGALREGDLRPLHFSVRNHGAAVASGRFEASLSHPDGSLTMLDERAISLGLLDAAGYTGSFAVGPGTPPGAYTFRGRFDYAWTNATTGEPEHGSIVRETAFEVRRVQLALALSGLDARTAPGDAQAARAQIRNEGNDPATGLRVRFTAPDHYAFLHAEDAVTLDPRFRYASPPPDSVVEDPAFGRVTLAFEVADLAPGASWSFDTTLFPTRPGTHSLLLVALYCDPAERCSSKGQATRQEIALVPP